MAMLAEPRRRKRYNLCPRGKALYEDDTRFGTKMLEKMGWSKGKGLGANLDGDQNFVRVRLKNDAEGLGYEARDDQWTTHEDGFNGLLNSLNGVESKHELNAESSDVEMRPTGFGFKMDEEKPLKSNKLKEQISGVSLEEKSKQSKARVHYKKFTRGKDLSRYSEKDLANIFGKKATDMETFNVPIVKEPLKSEEKDANPKFSGVQTVSTGLSVSDYFKQKMEEKNKRMANANGVSEMSGLNAGENQIAERDTAMEIVYAEPVKKKKKKDRHEEQPAYAHNEQTEGNSYENENTEFKKPKKKKKKKFVQEEENQLVMEPIENIDVIAKKNKKKKKEKCNERLEVQLEVERNEVVVAVPDIKKKKDKCKEVQEEQLEKSKNSIDVEVKKSKKKKKEKDNEGQLQNNPNENDVSEAKTKKEEKQKSEAEVSNILTPAIEYPLSKKKKGKSKEEVHDFTDDASLETTRKKKSKRDKTEESLGQDLSTERATKKKKMSKPVEETVQKENSDVSFASAKNAEHTTQQLLSLTDLKQKLDSYNNYTISLFCADKFQNFNINSFKNSNLAQVLGYGCDENLQLKIVNKRAERERIMSLWNGTTNKYSYNARVKLHKGQNRKKVIKSIKKRTAFTALV